MSWALHGHQILLVATLAFAVAVLTPNWYTSSYGMQLNVFQISVHNSSTQSFEWLFPLSSNNSYPETIKIIYPILVASSAIACAGLSLISLLLGSWYIQRFADDDGSKWLLILTIIATLFSFLFSCGVWTIMLTTNLHQKIDDITAVRLENFGFSFWINIGSSGLYLYAFLMYLVAICKNY